MLQTPHLFSHQQHYGPTEQASWTSLGNSQQGLSHAQHHAQAQAAAAAAAQQQHYSRIAGNQHNHAAHAQIANSANRQGSGDNSLTSTSLSAMNNEQCSPGMESGISEENRKVLQWVAELMDEKRREGALMELSKKREQVPELALVLWHSFGVMTSLLQEIISVYPMLNPSQLTAAASNRVCNALALLQCVASHNETRVLFLNGMLSMRFDYDSVLTHRRSPHSPLPLPLSQHDLEVEAFRVSPTHLPWSDWGSGKE
jgi:CCR4-NOT transcription complex subunit 9